MKPNLLRFSLRKMKEHIRYAKELMKERMDRKTKDALAMECFQAVNYAIDFMDEYVKRNELGVAFSYMELVDILEERRLIDGGNARKIRRLIALRNKIAHEYHVIYDEEVIEMAKMLNALKSLERLI